MTRIFNFSAGPASVPQFNADTRLKRDNGFLSLAVANWT